MSTTNLAKLHLPHLKYDVADIQKTLAAYKDFDCFIFLQCFNADSEGMPALHLLSYAHGNTMQGQPGYHEVYYNGSSPDPLLPVGDKIVKLEAPVTLVPNGVSRNKVEKLIEHENETVDALIFIPKINESNLIYYKIRPAKLVGSEYIFFNDAEDDGENSNPSPPATIESLGG
jgi:hypothetical protein